MRVPSSPFRRTWQRIPTSTCPSPATGRRSGFPSIRAAPISRLRNSSIRNTDPARHDFGQAYVCIFRGRRNARPGEALTWTDREDCRGIRSAASQTINSSRARTIEGDLAGKHIGEIDHLMIDRISGRVGYAVISFSASWDSVTATIPCRGAP
jgi:hypothetical protein